MNTYNNYMSKLFTHAKIMGCKYIEIVHVVTEKTQFSLIDGDVDNRIISFTEEIYLSVNCNSKTGCVYTEYFYDAEKLLLKAIDNVVCGNEINVENKMKISFDEKKQICRYGI